MELAQVGFCGADGGEDGVGGVGGELAREFEAEAAVGACGGFVRGGFWEEFVCGVWCRYRLRRRRAFCGMSDGCLRKMADFDA